MVMPMCSLFFLISGVTCIGLVAVCALWPRELFVFAAASFSYGISPEIYELFAGTINLESSVREIEQEKSQGRLISSELPQESVTADSS
jgi:hypothetical protein